MNSLSFLRQMLQDIRHQKVRTALTLFGSTWGTVSVALLVSFGEGLQRRIQKNQRGLGKSRPMRVTEDDLEVLRREIPEARFSGEYARSQSTFRRERARLTPDMSATNPVFAVMRNLIPASGGRYVNDLDLDRRRRV